MGTNADGIADAAEANLIVANGGNGVSINGVGADFNVVAGNQIGINPLTDAVLGNAGYGVIISEGATFNRVGTNGDAVNDEAEGNVITGSNIDGVRVNGDVGH